MAGAKRLAVCADGARYNKSIADERFPRAIRILDLCRTREDLSDFARKTCPLPLGGPAANPPSTR